MLYHYSHWHFACERTPYREARLLAFSTGTPTGGGGDEPPPSGGDDYAFPPEEGSSDGSLDYVQTRRTEAPSQTRSTSETINQNIRGTRGPVAAVLRPRGAAGAIESGDDDTDDEHGENKQEEKITPQGVDNSVQETLDRIGRHHRAMSDLDASASDVYGGKALEYWKQSKATLAMFQPQFHSFKNYTSTILQWESGEMTPNELVTKLDPFLQEFFPSEGNVWKKDVEEFMKQRKERYGDTTEKALLSMGAGGTAQTRAGDQTINESTQAMIDREKKDIIEGVTKRINLLNILRRINEESIVMRQAMEQSKIEDMILKVKEADDKKKEEEEEKKVKEQTPWQVFQSTTKSLGIKFYSVKELGEGVKQVWDAFKEAWHARSHHRAAEFGVAVAKMLEKLPYGPDIEQVLESGIQRHDDEEKNKYMEFLKSRNVGFGSLFVDHHNLMDANRTDPNRARGVLEYAASKGWLYDIDTIQFAPAREKKFFGRFRLADYVPADWSDTRINEYFYVLLGQNKSGADNEENSTYGRIKDIENPPAFIKNLEAELDGLNLWSAMGVCKRAIERGLWAEISPWLTTTIMRKLQDPKVRKYIPRSWLDKVGSLAFYRTSFTLGVFKGERKKFDAWLKTGDKDDLTQIGTFGKVIKEIRDDIESKKGNLDFTTAEGIRILDRYTARVLAGELVELPNGATVTIFDTRYAFYRNSDIIKKQGEVESVEKEDPDYYTQTTDNIIAGGTPVDQILQVTGNAKFQHESKAQHYLGNVLREHGKLQAAKRFSAAEALRKEFGTKISGWFVKQLGDSRTTGLADYQTMESGEEGPYAIATFIRKGYMPIDPAIKTYWDDVSNSGTGLAGRVLEQIDTKLKQRIDGISKKDRTTDGLFETIDWWYTERAAKVLEKTDRRMTEQELMKSLAPPKKRKKQQNESGANQPEQDEEVS